LDAAIAVMLPVTVVMFAFGSSSVQDLVRVGSRGRWLALLALAALAVTRVTANGARPRALPPAWALAGALVILCAESASWSVDPRLTLARAFSVGVLFVTGVALALAPGGARHAASQALIGILRGAAAVALLSLLVLAVSRHDAVQPATAGAGWRFRGIGLNPNTVSMLLAIALPLAVWRLCDGVRRARWEGGALVLLFVGEIALSGSRGALVAGFVGALVTAFLLAASSRARLALALGLAVLAAASVAVAKLPNPAPAVVAPSSAGAPSEPVSPADAERSFRLQDELGFPLAGAYHPPAPRTILGSSGRAQAWDGAVRQGAKRPVAGYGFGTEQKVFVDRFFTFEGGFVENTYIGLFLQLGVAGALVFAALLASLAWSAVRVGRGTARAHAALGAGASGVLVAAALIGVSQTGLLAVGNIAASSIWICVLTLPLLAREQSA
jgi:hypothetical protein